MIRKQMSGRELRRWASQCAREAEDPNMSGANRERLLKMQTALLELAKTEDWLAGQAVVVDVILPREANGAKAN